MGNSSSNFEEPEQKAKMKRRSCCGCPEDDWEYSDEEYEDEILSSDTEDSDLEEKGEDDDVVELSGEWDRNSEISQSDGYFDEGEVGSPIVDTPTLPIQDAPTLPVPVPDASTSATQGTPSLYHPASPISPIKLSSPTIVIEPTLNHESKVLLMNNCPSPELKAKEELDPVKRLLAEVKEKDTKEKEEREKRRKDKKRSREEDKDEKDSNNKKKRRISEDEDEGGEFLFIRGVSPGAGGDTDNWDMDRRGNEENSPDIKQSRRGHKDSSSPIRERMIGKIGKRPEPEPKREYPSNLSLSLVSPLSSAEVEDEASMETSLSLLKRAYPRISTHFLSGILELGIPNSMLIPKAQLFDPHTLTLPVKTTPLYEDGNFKIHFKGGATLNSLRVDEKPVFRKVNSFHAFRSSGGLTNRHQSI